MIAKTLMIQGTSSSAGKSLMVTALCRIFARRGIRVAPFKAQNMSNNAGVCANGSEIGRAQITQAFAAGIEPTAAMNPILLKPESNMRSQVVVMGKAFDTLPARSYYQRKQMLWHYVAEALDQLRAEYELVIIEGAGSPVELNLKKNDIVNMAVARYAQSPVVLVGDIDRGGIFPQLLGTLWLLPPEEQELVKGFIVNKFRGDPTLFEDGIRILEERSGKSVFGVVPWITDLHLPEEDAVALDNGVSRVVTHSQPSSTIDIAVIHLPRIANFDDFDPLQREHGVSVRYVQDKADLGTPDAVIIPGTKSTLADLKWLHERKLTDQIMALAQKGTAVVGICGGYQMLGTEIRDPQHVESTLTSAPGLGLLPIQTDFVAEKATYRAKATIAYSQGWLAPLVGTTIQGYEIHMGQTDTPVPWLTITQRGDQQVSALDGAISADQRIWGCYLHGLFANHTWRRAWLSSLGHHTANNDIALDDFVTSLDKLADDVEKAICIEELLSNYIVL